LGKGNPHLGTRKSVKTKDSWTILMDMKRFMKNLMDCPELLSSFTMT